MNDFRMSMAPLQTLADGGDGAHQSSLEGFYLLTRQGSLARFDACGIPVVEPALTAGLAAGIETVLERYSDGEIGDLCLALAVEMDPTQGRSGALVFADEVLNKLFDAGRRPGTLLTPHEERNKWRSFSEGMDLLLENKNPSLLLPYFCPVLFEPELDRGELYDRYGIDVSEPGNVFEVLDLSAPFFSSHRPPGELFVMRSHMRRQRVGRGAPGETESTEVPPPEPAAPPGMMQTLRPDGAEPVPADTCFSGGEPVTGWLLEWFSPFNELSENQRDIVAGYEIIHRARPGTRLIQRGSVDDKCLYLVEGELLLTAEDGTMMRVNGGTRRSRLPISVLTPHAYEVIAVSEVSIIVFSQALVCRINEITRTYIGINRPPTGESRTAAVSNGAQSAYLNHAALPRPSGDS